jgi:HTH-type transcriptional regulator/antitoxin HigA
VILPFLRGSNLSGVTKWIGNENCVMVAVNDFGKDADKIWFSIFHEIGHAIKNHKRHLTISYNKDNIQDKDEIEANEYAKNTLIDESSYQEFIKNNNITESSIKRFAKEQPVAPFIVVGRLQKDGIIGWDKFQNLKPKYTISF